MLIIAVTDKTGSGALLSTWLSAHKRMILAGAIPKLCQIAFVFTQPLLVERAIAFAATPSTREHNNVGYGLIGAYVLVYFGIAVRWLFSAGLSQDIKMHASREKILVADILGGRFRLDSTNGAWHAPQVT